MTRFVRKLAWLAARRRKEAELREELEFHVAEEAEERLAAGVTEARARAEAQRSVGNLTLVAEDTAATWGWPRLEQIGQDLRYAMRTLLKTPGFTTVAVVSLALGIGATTAIFSVVHSVLLKPLPYAAPNEIHSVEVVVPELRDQFPSLPLTVQAYLEWKKSRTVFSAMAAVRPWECNLTSDGEPERLGGARVSANFFALLGVPIARGRDFLADEEQPGNERVVVISDALWRRRYGADGDVVGRTILINGEAHVVVGVAPPSLLVPTGTQLHPLLPFASRIDVWKPIAPTVGELKNESWDHGILVRLPASADIEQGRRQLGDTLNAMVHAQMPNLKTEAFIRLVPVREIFSGNVRLRLLMVFAASALLLLLTACTNIANLFLARMASRAGEFATRIALGAGRARIVGQTLTETLAIALAGGALGAVIAHYGARLLAAYGPADLPLLADARVNLQVFAFATLASVATGLVCGIVPAWHIQRKDSGADLREGARSSIGGGRAARARQVLIAVEMALGTALLASAALLLHSFVNVMGAERGYQIERVMTVDLSLFGERYATAPGRIAFYQALVTNVRALPGVLAAGAVNELPAVAASTGASRTVLYESDDSLRRVLLARPVAMVRSVTAGYFAASGTSLRAGRLLADDERGLVAVISESLAHRLWPHEPLTAVLNRRIRHDAKAPLVAIVGVVEDARAGGVDREPPPVVYRPYQQWASGPMTLVVKTAQEPAALAPAVRQAIRAMDPNLPIAGLRTMHEIVSSAVAQRRFQLVLMSLFAIVALLLSAVGLYGVVSYAVACRTRDIGLRMALGAAQHDVMGWVFSHGLRPVLIGLAAGLASAVAIARALRGVLFGVAPADPLSLGAVGLVLLVTSALACYLPARRAAAVDPMTALRHQ